MPDYWLYDACLSGLGLFNFFVDKLIVRKNSVILGTAVNNRYAHLFLCDDAFL